MLGSTGSKGFWFTPVPEVQCVSRGNHKYMVYRMKRNRGNNVGILCLPYFTAVISVTLIELQTYINANLYSKIILLTTGETVM